MKLSALLSVILILVAIGYGGSIAASLQHEVPVGVVQGETVRLEVISLDMSFSAQDMRLYYRELGEESYRQLVMEREGNIYVAEMSTRTVTTGQVEYYIVYESSTGEFGSLPETAPQLEPFVLHVAPARVERHSRDVEVVVLSPEPKGVLEDGEVVVAVSVLPGDAPVDYTTSRLFVDGVDVGSGALFTGGIVAFVPDRLPGGWHTVELRLCDSAGNLVDSEEWSFRVIERMAGPRAFDFRGTIFLSDRYQDVSSDDDNFLRGGITLSGHYHRLDFSSRILMSSEESAEQQPVNRYSGELRYNFSSRNHLYLGGGDFIPLYNPLVFRDKRVRGGQGGATLGDFVLDCVYGQTYRAVEGSLDVSDEGDTLRVDGTYSETVLAVRPGMRYRDYFRWNFNLINAKEDEHSITYGGNVKEALVLGTDLTVNMHGKRIAFEASVQASIKNSDAGGPEVEYDDLVELDSSLEDNTLAEKVFDLIRKTGFLSATQGLNPYPSLAMQFELRLRYLRNNLKLSYMNIDSEFESPGNPYLLKDIAGFYLSDNIRLLDNQVFLNLFFKNYDNNITEETYSTSNTQFGVTASYYPLANYPSITLGYDDYSRCNGVAGEDTVRYEYLYIEDNRTRRVSATSSYDVDIGDMRNTLSFNVSNYIRDDEGNSEGDSDFLDFTVGAATKFAFPMTAKASYSRAGTSYGDTTVSTIDIDRYNLRLEYRLKDLLARDLLRPFFNISYQDIVSDFSSAGNYDTTRLNLSGGLSYQTADYGRFSLRFDQINSTEDDVKSIDRVINAYYEYRF